MNNRVVIRVDAHKRIALGHLKRCLALAEGLRMQNLEILFVSMREEAVESVFERSSFFCEFISEEINSVGDLERTLALIRSFNASCIIVDSYNIDQNYIRFYMEQGIAVIYIDDLARTDIACHVVVNGLLGADKIPYDVPVKLLGKDFLILCKEYWTPPIPRRGSVRNILITMGGIDHYDLSTRTLQILERHKNDFSVSVVMGAYYENKDRIEAQRKAMSKRVGLHFSPDSLFPLMDKCNMAISAGGLTLYELATMGKPAIGVGLWENQYWNVRALGDRNIIEPLFYVEDASFDARLETTILCLIDDEKKRLELSVNGQRYFDGQGAVRVAKRIAEFVKGE